MLRHPVFALEGIIGTLFIVATPIGNLEDITLRALRILREARLIAAEDTRHTRRLLAHYDIDTPMVAYHEHNKLTRLSHILAALATGDVALVSDAGTPAINDPGYELVQATIEAGFSVQPVPGPAAPIAALVASGLPTATWLYLGFLPSRSPERRRVLASWRTTPATLICFETPHRLTAALRDIDAVLGNRRMAVARELTKLHEEWVRGDVAAAMRRFEETPPRGEFTLVIAGYEGEEDAPATEIEADWRTIARERLSALRVEGFSASAAARVVARELRQPRGAVYDLWSSLAEDTTTAAPLSGNDEDQ